MKDFESCGVYSVIKLLNGKWKPFIIYLLSTGDHTFNEIWRRIPKVSKKVLSEQLKDMMANKLIEADVPKYRLAKRGLLLLPLLQNIQEWSTENLDVISETEEVLLPKT